MIIAFLWLMENPSQEEAIGATGKIWDLLQGKVTGWSPNYLLGGSLVVHQVAGWAVLFESLSLALFGPVIGFLAALKLVALGYIMASAWCMYLFVSRLTSDRLITLLASLAYITLPSINVAVGVYEHFTVGLCFVFTPLILRGILVVAEERSPREIIGLGMAAAALALSYTKIAVVMSPMLLLWTLEVLRLHPERREKTLFAYAMSAGVAALLSILILLPALREFHFAAGFLFEPLDAWQHHYAFKSALQWIDLWGVFMRGGGPNVEGDASMFVIGFMPLVAVSLALGLPSLQEWRCTKTGRWFLILVACWLASTWFAAGPDGILLGHWNILKNASAMPNISIPLLWLALAWMMWMIYQTTRQLIGGPAWRSWLLLFIFVSLPIFRVVEIFPLFKDIRAPESFWSVGGFCALAVAIGISTATIFTQLVPKRFVTLLAVAVGILFLAEMYPVHSAYWTRGLPSELLTEYNQAALFLKSAPLPGRVQALCTRYFYLNLPQKAGRSVASESLLRHFQLKWVRYFENASYDNIETLKSYLNLAGVSYILIDKEDPVTPPQLQSVYRSLYPVVFENQDFAILENRGSFYPALLARNFVALPQDSYAMAPVALQLANMNFLTVEIPQVDQSLPGFAGFGKEPNQVQFLPAYQAHPGAPFQHMDLVGQRIDDDQQMTYKVLPDASGWLTVTEAFHPDWRATIDGHPTEVHRAAAALLSVNVPSGSNEIIFKFVPPVWYALCLYGGIFNWILALGIFVFFSSRFVSPKWKKWWVGKV